MLWSPVNTQRTVKLIYVKIQNPFSYFRKCFNFPVWGFHVIRDLFLCRVPTPRASSRSAESRCPSQDDFPPLPSIGERLAHLNPSHELLDYYRKKIADFDEEHEELVKRLEKYKQTYDEQVRKWVVEQLWTSRTSLVFLFGWKFSTEVLGFVSNVDFGGWF